MPWVDIPLVRSGRMIANTYINRVFKRVLKRRCTAAAALLVAGSACLAGSTPVPSGHDREAIIAKLHERGLDAIGALVGQMVPIPAGRFQMGNAQSASAEDERPVHWVQVPAFRMGKFEVTFEQYEAYSRATGAPLPDDSGWGRGSLPVTNVSWDDAQAFVAWLRQVTGLAFRLPSEAEWEYAARAGTTTVYPWGDTISHDDANYGRDACCGGATGGRDRWLYAAPVGSFPPNAFGLYDMIGNVWEWTQDCWNGTYVGAPQDGSAWLTGECSRRIYRGGSWDYIPSYLRASKRVRNATTLRRNILGFRVAEDM